MKSTLVLLALIALVSCNNQDHLKVENIEEPANIIPINQAKEMYEAYGERVPILKEQFAAQGVEYDPTRYVEYELEDLRHYLNYIENEASKAHVEIENVRIYLGAYPDQSNFDSSGEAIPFPRQESIFITPTALNNGEQMAFFTRGIPGDEHRAAVFTKGLGEALYDIDGFGNKSFEKASFLPFTIAQDSTDDRSLTMNRGNVIPPPKEDDDFGDDNGGG